MPIKLTNTEPEQPSFAPLTGRLGASVTSQRHDHVAQRM